MVINKVDPSRYSRVTPAPGYQIPVDPQVLKPGMNLQEYADFKKQIEREEEEQMLKIIKERFKADIDQSVLDTELSKMKEEKRVEKEEKLKKLHG